MRSHTMKMSLALAALLLSACTTPQVKVAGNDMHSSEGNVVALKSTSYGEVPYFATQKERGTSKCGDVYAFTFAERVAKDAVEKLGAKLADTALKVELIADPGEPFACATNAPITTALTVATGAYLFTGPTRVIHLNYRVRASRYGEVAMASEVKYTERETGNVLKGHSDTVYSRAADAMVEETYKRLRQAGAV